MTTPKPPRHWRAWGHHLLWHWRWYDLCCPWCYAQCHRSLARQRRVRYHH